MTDARTRRRPIAVVLSLLVLCGTVGATTTLAVGPVLGEPDDDLEIDPALEETVEEARADGTETVEVIVRLEAAPVQETPDGAVEDELEKHAAETQTDLLAYAEDAAGIDVVTEFWVANAVLLELDPVEVDLETFDRFEEVTALHGNVAISTPEPPAGFEADGEGPRGNETTDGLAMIGAPTVWEAHGTRGEGVKVAVLDTGIDVDHPDLSLSTDDPTDPTYPGGWAEFDATGAPVEGSEPYDSGSHGTHVSGTVAGGNASGTHVGVAPDVDLAHGLVLDDDGGTFAQAVAGFEWALGIDADVVSVSFGVDGTEDAFVEPVRNVRHGGVVVVGAVGNDGEGNSSSPGNVNDVVSVGAVGPDERVAPFSGGERLGPNDWSDPPADWPETYVVPDVVAPGVDVESTVPGGGYERMPGTSMATPHVSGTVALLLSVDGDLTPADVDEVLAETARKPADAPDEVDHRYGNGVVDAAAAADAVAAREPVDGGADHPDPEVDTTSNVTVEPAVEADPVPGPGVVVALVAVGLVLAFRAVRT